MHRQYKVPSSASKSSQKAATPAAAKRPQIQTKGAQGSNNLDLSRWTPGGKTVDPLARAQQSLQVQAKLSVGEPNDKYEQEADRVAHNVVNRIHSAPSDITQREANEQADTKVQLKPAIRRSSVAAGGDVSAEIESEVKRAKGGGQALHGTLQKSMGDAMGADFSNVRVHADSQSDQLNQAIQAKAFTTGNDVFFKKGEYNPGSKSGQELIAHELTHVVQQGGANIQRKLPPAEEGKLEKIITEQQEEEKLQKKPDNTVQRSAKDSIQASAEQGVAIQRMGKSTYKSESGGDVTAVTRNGGFGWSAGLTKDQKTKLLASVDLARKVSVAAKGKYDSFLTSIQNANTWKEVEDIDYDTAYQFSQQFSGTNRDLATLRPYMTQTKQVIDRCTAGLAGAVKIVENKPKKDKEETENTMGYVKVDYDTEGNRLPFLDPKEHRPGNIHLNFAHYLSNLGTKNDAARTIYHEATHRFARTDDKLGYGKDLGAGKDDIANTVKNADCQAYFVDQIGR